MQSSKSPIPPPVVSFLLYFQDDLWIWDTHFIPPRCHWGRDPSVCFWGDRCPLFSLITERLVYICCWCLAGALVRPLSIWSGSAGDSWLPWSLFSFPRVFAKFICGPCMPSCNDPVADIWLSVPQEASGGHRPTLPAFVLLDVTGNWLNPLKRCWERGDHLRWSS